MESKKEERERERERRGEDYEAVGKRNKWQQCVAYRNEGEEWGWDLMLTISGFTNKKLG